MREARQSILDGKQDVSILLNEKVGEIKATILERDGQILGVHKRRFGRFRDVYDIDMSADAARSLDRRLVLAAAVGLDALQAR